MDPDTTQTAVSLFQWASIASVWSGVIGLPLSIWGLWWTWQAKNSAKSAAVAASSAAQAVRNLERGFDVNLIAEKMRDLKEAIQADEKTKVSFLAAEMRRGMVKIRSDGAVASSIGHDKINSLVLFFGIVENNFGTLGVSSEFDLQAFNEQEDSLIEISQQIKGLVENGRI